MTWNPTCGVLTLEFKVNPSCLSRVPILSPLLTPRICSLHVTFVLHFSSSGGIFITNVTALWRGWTQKMQWVALRTGILWSKHSLRFCTQSAPRGESPVHFRYIFLACRQATLWSLTSLWMTRPAQMHRVLSTAWTASWALPKLIYSHHLTPGPCLSANKDISSQPFFYKLNCFTNCNYKCANEKLKIWRIHVLLLWNHCIKFSSLNFNFMPWMEKLFPFRALRYVFAHSIPSFKKQRFHLSVE